MLSLHCTLLCFVCFYWIDFMRQKLQSHYIDNGNVRLADSIPDRWSLKRDRPVYHRKSVPFLSLTIVVGAVVESPTCWTSKDEVVGLEHRWLLLFVCIIASRPEHAKQWNLVQIILGLVLFNYTMDQRDFGCNLEVKSLSTTFFQILFVMLRGGDHSYPQKQKSNFTPLIWA